MNSIVKWLGSKERFLGILAPLFPSRIRNYYEPFVGSGACFLNIDSENCFINDKCKELMSLYKYAPNSRIFYDCIRKFNQAWRRITDIYTSLEPDILCLYRESIHKQSDYNCLRTSLAEISSRLLLKELIDVEYCNKNQFALEKDFHLTKTILRLSKSNEEVMTDIELSKQFLTSFKAAFYTYLREVFNAHQQPGEIQSAIFYFLLSYSVNGHFLLDAKGRCNLSYMGISGNDFSSGYQLMRLRSGDVKRKLNQAHLYHFDFLSFLNRFQPCDSDFIFLDPPIDGTFNRYGSFGFTKKDHERLSYYLRNTCHAKWMLSVRNTVEMRQLYDSGVGILKTYGKGDANLLITNYR